MVLEVEESAQVEGGDLGTDACPEPPALARAGERETEGAGQSAEGRLNALSQTGKKTPMPAAGGLGGGENDGVGVGGPMGLPEVAAQTTVGDVGNVGPLTDTGTGSNRTGGADTPSTVAVRGSENGGQCIGGRGRRGWVGPPAEERVGGPVFLGGGWRKHEAGHAPIRIDRRDQLDAVVPVLVTPATTDLCLVSEEAVLRPTTAAHQWHR